MPALTRGVCYPLPCQNTLVLPVFYRCLAVLTVRITWSRVDNNLVARHQSAVQGALKRHKVDKVENKVDVPR